MLIYINGSWVEKDTAVVPFADQGFLYGDSLFETIRINSGSPFRLGRHLARMGSGMDTIQMSADHILAEIPGLIDTFIKKNDIGNALIRVMVTRGVSDGSPWNSTTTPAIYITARDFNEVPAGPVPIIFLEEKNYPLLRFYPAIKSGNYLGNMLAKNDAETAGAFEPVFINRDGYVTECAIRNIFFIKEKTLLTPSVKLGVLPGVIRETIMELATNRGLEVEEAFIFAEDIHSMDEAFISSTGVGVLPVTWDGFSSIYKQSHILRADLNELFNSGDINVT